MKPGETFIRRSTGVFFMIILIIVSTIGVLALKYIDFTYRAKYSVIDRTCTNNNKSLSKFRSNILNSEPKIQPYM